MMRRMSHMVSDISVTELLLVYQYKQNNCRLAKASRLKHTIKGVQVMKKVFVRRFAMIIVAAAIATGVFFSAFRTNTQIAEAKSQMMDICCPHCNEIISVDIMMNDLECPCCAEHIHIDG